MPKKKPGNPKGQGTPNTINAQNLDYRLPNPPWQSESDSTGGDATLDLTGLTSIPLDILNRGTVRNINSDDFDGFAYDVLIWQLDGAAIGFAQEVNVFQEAADASGSTSKRVDIPLIPNNAIQSAVVLIADSAYPTAQLGTETSDLLIGNQDSNGVSGADGDDVIWGLEDRDSLVGDRGNDWMNGGSSGDVLVGNSGNDQLYGEEGSDRLNGLDGEDTLRGGTDSDFLFGGDGNDTLYGGSGDDQLDGQVGSDTLYGGAGNDTYILDDTADTIVELANQGIDTVEASFNNVVLQADLENLVLVGSDALTGTANNSDNIITVDDDDPSGASVINRTISALGGNDQIATDRLVSGGFSAAKGNDIIDGGAGNDRIRSGDGNDTLNGGEGDDELDGDDDNDTLNGGGGNDILFGSFGTNTLNGGNGNDTLFSESNDTDTLTGGAGADLFSFSFFRAAATIQDFNPNEGDRIRVPNFVFPLGFPAISVTASNFSFSAGALSVFTTTTGTFKVADVALAPGTSFNINRDLIVGDRVEFTSTLNLNVTPAPGSEPVAGLTLNGTANSDRLFGDEGADQIKGGAGNDIVSGLEGNDDLKGEQGNDTIDGGSGSDRVQGEDGDDNLYGEAGDDTLEGGNGNDKLTGGVGNDTLTGGAGADIFNFYDSVVEPLGDAGGNPDTVLDGVDVITDFNVAEDKIGLYGGLYGADSPYRLAGLTVGSSLTADQFQVGAAAVDAGDRLIYNSGTGALFFDADGTGATAQIQIATLAAGLALSNTSFTVIGDTTTSLGSDNITGTDGDDNINGNSGDDNISGGTGADKLIGGKGNDRLTGGDDNDTLIGNGGNDRLYGGAGNDRLNGGQGKDVLYGGLGSDRLKGGKGKDTFVLEKGAGRDLILDFKDGVDRLGLTPGLKFKKLAIVSQGRSTLIRVGNDPLALLKGVQSSSITAADFVNVGRS